MEHVCSNDTCLFVNRDGIITCKVTGKCYNQFVCANHYKVETNDLFTNLTQQSHEHRQNKKSDSVAKRSSLSIQNEVEKYVNLLLYSKIRNDIASKFPPVQQTNKKQRRHYKKRRKVAILEYKEETFKEICNEITASIFKLTQLSKQNTKTKPMIIALLFLKQHGKEYKTKTQNTFLIKRSDFLYHHLPSISDLHLFNIPKNLIRIGSNIIQKIIRNI